MAESEIKIIGWREYNRALYRMDKDLPKGLRIAANTSAVIIVDWVVPRMPKRSGRASKSVKPRSTRTAARVVGGGNRAPHYPWLDFGGRVGRKRSVEREYIQGGRYLYPGYAANVKKIKKVLRAALIQVAKDAGIDVKFYR